MEHHLDRLAKSVAGAMTRRQALWRFGKGLGLTALAAAGLAARRKENCAECCTTACRTLDPPPRGHEMAVCITTCLETGQIGGFDVCTDVCVDPPV